MKNKKTAGISLVALVVTIIVLIILTASVIVTFMEGGIIDRAKEAVFKSDIRTYQEILLVKNAKNEIENAVGTGGEELNASTLTEIQEVIPEFKDEYDGLIAISNGEIVLGASVEEDSNYEKWLADLGVGLSKLPENAIALADGLEVGDYVVYNPDGTIPADLPLSLTRQNINWRVLKNDGRQVTLISEAPIDSITLEGKEGFLNGSSRIDTTYAGLYSGSKGAARNLKVEDVNEAMGVEIGSDVKPYYTSSDANNVEMGAGATLRDAMNEESYDVSDWSLLNDSDKDYELLYYYEGSAYQTAENTTVYNMIFKDVTDISKNASKYWLSSSCIYATFFSKGASLGLRAIDSGKVDGSYTYEFFFGSDDSYNTTNSGRPIVVLKSNVEVSNPAAGGDTVDTAWQLK